VAHQSLYRKYRPQSFGDIVGQDHITRTLRNAVEEGSVAHAYLFCGPRGTGKTTTARILAKALDCEKGPTPDPDDTCEQCREIAEGRHPDVYELDAASRTGVDAVRDEIITKVNYAATRGGYKVYIIDEVHMLSTSAFNALLKTLEEPPPKTVFILCTTHPHKVPETIHSRCQRFDFRRIGVDDIVGRLASISQREGITVEDGALPLIARHAAGGMRDAIGTLDQLAAFTGKSVALADVEGLLGEVDSARLAEITGLIADRDAAGCFRFVARLAEAGTDVPEFVRGLTAHIRDLYVLTAGAEADGVVEATHAELERLRAQTAQFDLDRLGRLLDLLGQLAADVRWAPDARLTLEVALTRMARPGSDMTLESLAERVSVLESGAPVAESAPRRSAPGPAAVAVAPRPAAVASPAPAPVTPAESPADTSAVVAPALAASVPARRTPRAGGADTASLRRSWGDILREMKTRKPATSKLFIDTEVDLDGDTVVVEFAPNRRVPMQVANEQENVALLRECIRAVTGMTVAVRFQLGRGVVRPESVSGDGGNDAGPDLPEVAPGADVPLPAEPVSGVATDPAPSASTGADAERLLIDDLGAEVILERPEQQERAAPPARRHERKM
jgi:DNA polymerase-3 subunit gamma/tau